jgi:hypothetical protein
LGGLSGGELLGEFAQLVSADPGQGWIEEGFDGPGSGGRVFPVCVSMVITAPCNRDR